MAPQRCAAHFVIGFVGAQSLTKLLGLERRIITVL
jgi:hypothetical protein